MDDRSALVGAIERARAGGAKGAEVLRVNQQTLLQTSARGRPERAETQAWIVRVFLEGGRNACATDRACAAAVDRALALATKAPPDPLAGPAERMSIRNGGLGIDDHRHESIGDEDRAEILQPIERAFLQAGVRTRVLRYRQVREWREWMNTRGIEAEEQGTTYEVAAQVTLGDVEVAHLIASRHFSDVASLPFGAEVRRRLDALVRPLSLPSDPLPVVLEPRVMAQLVRAVAPAFAADAVRAGSFVGDVLGRRLAANQLHITDDAGLFGGLHTRAFDDRGVPPIAVTLLKEGHLHGLYHDPETARAAGLRPTGHVRGDRLAPSNLVVRPGARTRNVILTELRDFLVLDSVPAVDVVAGRLSGPARVVVVRGGDRVGAVKVLVDVSVVALLSGIAELAADQERSCEVDTPTAVFSPGVVQMTG